MASSMLERPPAKVGAQLGVNANSLLNVEEDVRKLFEDFI